MVTSSMMSAWTPATFIDASRVVCSTSAAMSTTGSLKRAVIPLRRSSHPAPLEDADVGEAVEVDRGLDLHVLLGASLARRGAADGTDGDPGREHALLEAAGDHDLALAHLGLG